MGKVRGCEALLEGGREGSRPVVNSILATQTGDTVIDSSSLSGQYSSIAEVRVGRVPSYTAPIVAW